MPLFKKNYDNRNSDLPPTTATSNVPGGSDTNYNPAGARGPAADSNYPAGQQGGAQGTDSALAKQYTQGMQPGATTQPHTQARGGAYPPTAQQQIQPQTATQNQDPNIPPAHALGPGAQQAHISPGHATTGKIEAAVGSMIGSKSLKAKGLQKEQEAQAYKVQGAELAEAERHEREALMRRERAVAHGAHPDHRHLGGMPGSATGGAGSGETAPGGLGGASSGGGY